MATSMNGLALACSGGASGVSLPNECGDLSSPFAACISGDASVGDGSTD
jgi:hypothetical protein